MQPSWFWPINMTVCARCGEPLPVAQAVAVSGPDGDGWAHVACPDAAA